jgi:hypothetical protein
MTAPDYKIGITSGSMVALSSILTTLPKANVPDYDEFSTMAGGKDRGLGGLQCEWRFSGLTSADITALRAYCSGKSADVYIRTLTEGNSYASYSAIMIWPKMLPPKAGVTYDYAFEFRQMVAL